MGETGAPEPVRDGDGIANPAAAIRPPGDEGTATENSEERLGSRIWQMMKGFYNNNIGLVLVFFAQIFASIVCCFPMPLFVHG